MNDKAVSAAQKGHCFGFRRSRLYGEKDASKSVLRLFSSAPSASSTFQAQAKSQYFRRSGHFRIDFIVSTLVQQPHPHIRETIIPRH